MSACDMCIALPTISGTATAPAYIANTCWTPSAANWPNGGIWSTGCFMSVPSYSAGCRPSYEVDSTTVIRVTLSPLRGPGATDLQGPPAMTHSRYSRKRWRGMVGDGSPEACRLAEEGSMRDAGQSRNEIRISNWATYWTVAPLDMLVAAPLVGRLLLGATPLGRLVQGVVL